MQMVAVYHQAGLNPPFPFFILLGPLRGLIFLLPLGIFTARVARIKGAFSAYSDVSCNDGVDTE